MKWLFYSVTIMWLGQYCNNNSAVVSLQWHLIEKTVTLNEKWYYHIVALSDNHCRQISLAILPSRENFLVCLWRKKVGRMGHFLPGGQLFILWRSLSWRRRRRRNNLALSALIFSQEFLCKSGQMLLLCTVNKGLTERIFYTTTQNNSSPLSNSVLLGYFEALPA